MGFDSQSLATALLARGMLAFASDEVIVDCNHVLDLVCVHDYNP
jgi:hypothetical protein